MTAIAAPRVTLAVLTSRQREVLALVVEGKKDREIAAALGISTPAASAHLERIRAKTGLHGRAQLVAWTVRQDLVRREEVAPAPIGVPPNDQRRLKAEVDAYIAREREGRSA